MNTHYAGVAALTLSLALIAPAMAGVGDLDTRFGVAGKVQAVGNSGPHLLELPDGRILVIGQPITAAEAPLSGNQVVISRFLASGTPDATFGAGGRIAVTLPVEGPWINAVALQPDGSVVMAGRHWNEGGQPFVARVDRNGNLDRGFGTDGVSEPGTGATEPYYTSLLVMPDGEIRASISDWTSDRIDRFAADGRPLGSLSGAIAPWRMSLQSDGRLIVSGYHRDLRRQVAMRLDSVGRVDPTFGDNGFAMLADGHGANLSVEPGSDRIVLCDQGVVRLTPDGRVDTTFGVRGTGYVAFGSDSVPGFDLCNRVLTTAGGAVVFVGVRRGSGVGGADQLFIAGLTPSGMVDSRLGAGSGASQIDIGAVQPSCQCWWDYQSSFIATRDGAALLSWLAPGGEGVTLARIELGAAGETGSAPPSPVAPPVATPAAAPAPTPASAPSPTITAGGNGNGGGGALTLFDVVLLAFGLGAAALSRRGTARP